MKHIKKIFLLVGFLSLSGGLKAQDAAWVQEVINSSSFKDDIEVIDLPLNELRVTGECHRGHKKRRNVLKRQVAMLRRQIPSDAKKYRFFIITTASISDFKKGAEIAELFEHACNKDQYVIENFTILCVKATGEKTREKSKRNCILSDLAYTFNKSPISKETKTCASIFATDSELESLLEERRVHIKNYPTWLKDQREKALQEEPHEEDELEECVAEVEPAAPQVPTLNAKRSTSPLRKRRSVSKKSNDPHRGAAASLEHNSDAFDDEPVIPDAKAVAALTRLIEVEKAKTHCKCSGTLLEQRGVTYDACYFTEGKLPPTMLKTGARGPSGTIPLQVVYASQRAFTNHNDAVQEILKNTNAIGKLVIVFDYTEIEKATRTELKKNLMLNFGASVASFSELANRSDAYLRYCTILHSAAKDMPRAETSPLEHCKRLLNAVLARQLNSEKSHITIGGAGAAAEHSAEDVDDSNSEEAEESDDEDEANMLPPSSVAAASHKNSTAARKKALACPGQKQPNRKNLAAQSAAAARRKRNAERGKKLLGMKDKERATESYRLLAPWLEKNGIKHNVFYCSEDAPNLVPMSTEEQTHEAQLWVLYVSQHVFTNPKHPLRKKIASISRKKLIIDCGYIARSEVPSAEKELFKKHKKELMSDPNNYVIAIPVDGPLCRNGHDRAKILEHCKLRPCPQETEEESEIDMAENPAALKRRRATKKPAPSKNPATPDA